MTCGIRAGNEDGGRHTANFSSRHAKKVGSANAGVNMRVLLPNCGILQTGRNLDEFLSASRDTDVSPRRRGHHVAYADRLQNL